MRTRHIMRLLSDEIRLEDTNRGDSCWLTESTNKDPIFCSPNRSRSPNRDHSRSHNRSNLDSRTTKTKNRNLLVEQTLEFSQILKSLPCLSCFVDVGNKLNIFLNDAYLFPTEAYLYWNFSALYWYDLFLKLFNGISSSDINLKPNLWSIMRHSKNTSRPCNRQLLHHRENMKIFWNHLVLHFLKKQ